MKFTRCLQSSKNYHFFQKVTTCDNKLVKEYLRHIKKFGNIISYDQEVHFKQKLFNKDLPTGVTVVTPRKIETSASNGSLIKVKLHQDMSALSDPPLYTFLMGIREHPINVYTYVVQNQDLYNLLSEETRNGLQKDIYLQKKPDSYPDNYYFKSFVRPLLVMDKIKGPIFKLRPTDNYEIIPLTDLAKSCYDELLKKRDEITYNPDLFKNFMLKKGDILVINNHKTLHTRDSFNANYDGTDRIVIRSYVNPYDKLFKK